MAVKRLFLKIALIAVLIFVIAHRSCFNAHYKV